MKVKCLPSVAALMVCGFLPALQADEADPAPQTDGKTVSYYTRIRPILQAHCQGCHQPAKASGEFVMTSFDRLLKGGATGFAAIVPGKPDESYLVHAITPSDGKTYMPKDKPPLSRVEIDLIRRWIAQGATDDTPASAQVRYDQDHPPVYTRPPVITSLDYSPDGKLLAVAGFHEVLLIKPDGSELVARLIGMAERIESVSFSPDGSKLLVTGGRPARMGEVQVWDVAKGELILSVPVTYDTVYGGSWSPDGKLIAFGCADNSIRAINATTGEQVLFQLAHSDWVRDTVFSVDGSHLVSVSRDMTVKLTEVASQRFVDNVTSITPGALRGGVFAVARHPKRDEIVIGGADGVVKVYRIHRQTKRVIGDDANLIRRMPPMKGRTFSVAVSSDGKRIAAGSSLDGSGQVAVYSYEFDTSLSDKIKKISEKRVSGRSAKEKAALKAYRTAGVKQIAGTEISDSGIYAVTFHPDGKTVAAAGADGFVRLIDAKTGEVTAQFSPAPLTDPAQVARNVDVGQVSNLPNPKPSMTPDGQAESLSDKEKLPQGASVTALHVRPAKVTLEGEFAYAQLLVTATLETGGAVDVTRMAQRKLSGDCVTVDDRGVVRPTADGESRLTLTLDGQSIDVPVTVTGLAGEQQVDYIRDVAPVLSRLGCNAGTCHGSREGKNGFKLSLRGYDPIFDVRALTDDLASRRINLASPDDSLALLKISGAAPHGGGVRTRPGEPYYEIIRNWIAGGAQLDLSTPRVTGIEIFPKNPVIQEVGSRQQVRVIATYDDGLTRDVTHEAFIESGSTETATTAGGGLMTSLRRGEAPILARYEGAYAATTLTVMGDRTGFVWKQRPTWGRIDELVAAKWKRMKIQPSQLCTDAEFLRRVYLDLTGLPPTADQVRAFLADSRETRVKRDEVIDKLIGSEAYVEYWTNKWADLLQVNGEFLGREGAVAFREWIRGEVATNTPYDEFARTILTASGSNQEHPAASYYKILREPNIIMENTTQLFLGVRFNCNKCHDHPFERWTQDQYYELAAYFANVGLKRDPDSGKRKIGGSAVEGAKPLYEIVYFEPEGEVTHKRTGKVVEPEFPFQCEFQAPQDATPREKLAAWVTTPDNPYFAMSYVNRLWGYMFGVGIIEPIDDIRAGNPPTNPALLDYLTAEFVESGFDARHMMTLICKSRTYQLSVATNRWNASDETNYSHALARRLPAEVIYDSIFKVTGSTSHFPELEPGTRAVELPGAGVRLKSGFLDKFGRPARESVCECARSSEMQMGPVMALISGPTLAKAISDPDNALAKLVARQPDNAKVVNELFFRILNRQATKKEIAVAIRMLKGIDEDHAKLVDKLHERQEYWKKTKPVKEKQRLEAIAKSKAELEAYRKELAPIRAEQERQRKGKIAAAEKALRKYESTLSAKLPGWEKQYPNADQWLVLKPTALKASNGAKLTAESDGAVLAEQKNGPVVYTFTAESDLTNITGIRLEALSDDSLPSKGPGLAKNGNFVLTEFALKAAPKPKPTEAKKVALQSALADFSQSGYAVATSIDGKRPTSGNGWAVAGGTGSTHWATFEIKKPIGFAGGTILTFTLDQRFSGKDHNLGKFRISVTAADQPVGLSVPNKISGILAVTPEKRTEEQTSALIAFMGDQDKELKERQQALAEAKKPLPADPKLTNLEAKLAKVSQPLPKDPKLVQLEKTVKISKAQLNQRRLTAAQDLAWALINSPAFLFNH